MGEGTSVARAQVLAAREALDEELVRLEASARAAVDIPAKIKRNPVKTAGLAAGAGFVVLGGPRKLFGRAKRAVRGPEEPLPASMLPKEIDETLRKLGTDGERVRGLLEHEFASYLKATEPARRGRNFRGAVTLLTVAFVRPLVLRFSKRLANEIIATDGTSFGEQLRKVRTRLGAAGDDETS